MGNDDHHGADHLRDQSAEAGADEAAGELAGEEKGEGVLPPEAGKAKRPRKLLALARADRHEHRSGPQEREAERPQ